LEGFLIIRNKHWRINSKQTTKMLTLVLLMAGFTLNASPLVQVTLEGTGGVSNGTDDVLPYYLSVNGVTLSADCYDFFNVITVGEGWQANIDTLAQAAASGMFSADPGALQGYELIAALATMATPTAQSQIDVQEDLWNVFDPQFSVTPGMASSLSTANSEISTFDFSLVEFIEPVEGENVQAFVTSDAPEPASRLLIGLGLLGVGIVKRRGAKVRREKPFGNQ
jgi:hypothetical protein